MRGGCFKCYLESLISQLNRRWTFELRCKQESHIDCEGGKLMTYMGLGHSTYQASLLGWKTSLKIFSHVETTHVQMDSIAARENIGPTLTYSLTIWLHAETILIPC